MRHKSIVRLLFLCLIFQHMIAAGGVAAQSGKDPLDPSGPIPWDIPSWPYMVSPTPYPIRPSPTPQVYTLTPTPTSTATLTPTPTNTAVPAGEQQESLATLAADNSNTNATLQALMSEEIAGETMGSSIEQVSNYAGYFFGYIKGLQLDNVHGMGSAITFLILALIVILLTKFVTAVLPMMATIARWTIDVLKLVGEYLPF